MLENVLLFIRTHCKELGYMLLFCVCLFLSRGEKKIIKELIEIMKFKTNNELYGKAIPGQTFSAENMRPVYKLNTATDTLEATGEYVDINEIIQTARDTCLQAVMEKFETLRKSVDTVSDDVQVYDGYRDKMDDLTVLIDRANAYREQFGLEDSVSLEDIYRTVDKKAVELKAKIEERKKIIKEQKNEKKKTDEESK